MVHLNKTRFYAQKCDESLNSSSACEILSLLSIKYFSYQELFFSVAHWLLLWMLALCWACRGSLLRHTVLQHFIWNTFAHCLTDVFPWTCWVSTCPRLFITCLFWLSWSHHCLLCSVSVNGYEVQTHSLKPIDFYSSQITLRIKLRPVWN